MHIAELSIKRPVFITCLILLILTAGIFFSQKLGVDLLPNVNFPYVIVLTQYPGAGPQEVETLVSKVLEDEISGVQGIKTMRSQSHEGYSLLVVEFDLDTDVKYDLQMVRDRVSAVRAKLPTDSKEPTIRAFNPGDQPVLVVALKADLPEAALYDLAKETLKPAFEQVNQVAQVDILGGRKREILVELDRDRLTARDVFAYQVARQINAVGKNIPVGKTSDDTKQTVYRTLGEFRDLNDISRTVVRYTGNEFPVTIADVGTVHDTLEEERSRTFVNGSRGLLFYIYRQSGANTVEVADQVVKRVAEVNTLVKGRPGNPELQIVRDGARGIRNNVADVKESIFIGIILTVLVVWFFLGSVRATLVTGMALPTSLLGAFVLMYAMGFTVNMMTLLALSLTVGLLIDDAIVVRENIFRHVELGQDARSAAVRGTKEVTLAVVATTLTVLAVFGPIAFLQGLVGRYFKEFGLTICFAMAISLFDAMTIAPMLSALFIGAPDHHKATRNPLVKFSRILAALSEGTQSWLDRKYGGILKYSLRHPALILLGSLAIFAGSIVVAVKWVPKTFFPVQDDGEFVVSMELPAGVSLEATARSAMEVDHKLRAHREVKTSVLTVGNANGEVNKANWFVTLVPRRQRAMTTSVFKDGFRQELVPYAWARPKVLDQDPVGSGSRAFNLSITGSDFDAVRATATKLLGRMKEHPALKDVDLNLSEGNPEFQVIIDKVKTQELGVASDLVGQELRTQIEGALPAVFREGGREYDIRVRLREDQRDLRKSYTQIRVPNINGSFIPLTRISTPIETNGLASINRENRARYIMLTADLSPGGPGIGAARADAIALLDGAMDKGAFKAPAGVHYGFFGQATYFRELVINMVLALALGILLIYLVLSSLYENFITPLTIMLVLPLAVSGGFLALGMTHKSLDLFSMIGGILLIGVATKNSILLVDRAVQLLAEGKTREEAILEAGRTRLRPILMTSFALVAGMIPIAIGLNEASSQRVSMGILLIGGLISSTVLSLLVIPAVFASIDRFRERTSRVLAKFTTKENHLPK